MSSNGERPEFLLLHVRLLSDAARILGGRPAFRPPPRRRLRPVMLTGRDWSGLPLGTREFIVSWHDSRGRLLESFGHPVRPLVFGHSEAKELESGMRGGNYEPEYDDRFLHLSVPAGAELLKFSRAEIREPPTPSEPLSPHADHLAADTDAGPRVLALTPLAVYALPGSAVERSSTEPMSLAWPIPDARQEIPIYPLKFFAFPELRWERRWPNPKRGWIAGHETILDSGPVEDLYNIVILGDGFAHDDQSLFDEAAKKFCTGLLEMPPFSELVDAINVHVVRTVSHDSGISDCPAGSGLKSTYYDVQGYYKKQKGDVTAEGFCGTPRPGRIYEAGELFAPRECIQLFVMLVNNRVYGGSAFQPLDLAIVTLGESDRDFINLGAHECGHVIANLAEEYISFVPWDALADYPNVVRASQLDGVWWKSLAQSDELDDAGELAIVRRYEQGDEANAHNRPKPPDLDEFRKLGLFWGGQYIDDDEPAPSLAGYNPFADPRGRNYFRGMVRCRMRAPHWDFCRVCSHAMSEIIRNPQA